MMRFMTRPERTSCSKSSRRVAWSSVNSPTAVRDNFRQVRAAAELRAHLVRQRTDVGARGAFDGETRQRAFDFNEAKFEHFDFHRP